MKRLSKPLLLFLSILGAIALTVLHQDPDGGAGAAPYQAGRQNPQDENRRYDLTALKVFSVALMRITDNYVDPTRVDPRLMLVEALHQVERNVAEVLVEEQQGGKSLRVRVGSHEKSFDIRDIDSPWSLTSRMRQVLRFIQAHLRPDTDIRDVEYAAINGMLSTLDPHSLLLNPDMYTEMKLSTRGEFGGLGIVISMVKGVLTVMNPMKDTPADAAGVKACDQILEIESEPTTNMTLNQAVSRLRGLPGSPVEVTLMRAGWSRPVRKMLTRAIIKVPSVDHRLLDKQVGYIRLRSFQSTSTDELRRALTDLRQQGMRGLVLDLRGNPGGLLDQAVKIADLFLDSGTLVTTVSHAGKKREEKRATSNGSEPRYPMAVLVSSGSASASEILAGALKNLDRGVIIGTRTFGKGSVQVLYDNDDGSALKLTIAQYLTPGDISIQSVGITPDVQTAPVLLQKNFIHLTQDDRSRREQDLDKHLTSRNVRADSQPQRMVRFLADKIEPEEGEEEEGDDEGGADDGKPVGKGENLCLYPDRECKPVDEDKFVLDFQIRMARDLLAETKSWRRSQILQSVDSFLERQRQDQERRIIDALRTLGVDWSPMSASSGKPRLTAQVTTDPPQGQAQSCRPMNLRLTVKNEGQAPTSQLLAVTKSTNELFNGHEFVFGRVDPGQTRSWDVPLKIRDAPTRTDDVTFEFRDLTSATHEPLRVPMSVKGVERPVFSYAYQLIDDPRGNGDGQAQRGEHLRLLVHVRNTGRGSSIRTITTLKNLSGEGINLVKGRFVLGELKPGEVKNAAFTFELEPSYAMDDFKLELLVYDDGLREFTSDKLKFPVADSREAPAKASGMVRVSKAQAVLRAWPEADAPVVGFAQMGTSFPVSGRLDGWVRVLAEKEQPAFLASSEVAPGGLPGQGRFEPHFQVTPPRLTLAVPTYSTEESELIIKSTVEDENRIIDAYALVRNVEAKVETRKIFYQANDVKRTPNRMAFSVKVPLWPGANYVSVFVRENEQVMAQESVVIYRRPPLVAAEKPVPSTEARPPRRTVVGE